MGFNAGLSNEETLTKRESATADFSTGRLAEFLSPHRTILSAGFLKNETRTGKKREVGLALLVALAVVGLEGLARKIDD